MMILGGTVMFAALFGRYAGLSFFTTEGLEFMNVFTYGSRDHGAYPVSVYGREALRLSSTFLCRWRAYSTIR